MRATFTSSLHFQKLQVLLHRPSSRLLVSRFVDNFGQKGTERKCIFHYRRTMREHHLGHRHLVQDQISRMQEVLHRMLQFIRFFRSNGLCPPLYHNHHNVCMQQFVPVLRRSGRRAHVHHLVSLAIPAYPHAHQKPK